MSARSCPSIFHSVHRLGSSLQAVEHGLGQGEAARASARTLKGPFGTALRRFIETTRRADAQIAELRAGLERGNAGNSS